MKRRTHRATDPRSQGTGSRRARAACLLFLGLAVAAAGCDRLQQVLLERVADEVIAGDRTDWLADDALHVVLCGTGSPLPDPRRAGPCTAVLADGHFFLVDVGPGSWENVQRWRLPRAELSGVLLTHFHSDHIGELGEVRMQSWAGGRFTPLRVYGPPGVERVVAGFAEAYALDNRYRISHHGPETMPPSGGEMVAHTLEGLPGPGNAPGTEPSSELLPFFEEGDLRVSVFLVDHRPVEPAVGYRFDYRGRSVVLSGDTARSRSLTEAARGADLLVHEALADQLVEPVSEIASERGAKRIATLARDILDYHTSPAGALAVAQEAGVPRLVLNHLVPSLPPRLADRLMLQKIGDRGDVVLSLGQDGQHFRLPAGSEAIEESDLD